MKTLHWHILLVVFGSLLLGQTPEIASIEEYWYEVSANDSSRLPVDYYTALQINTYAGNLEKVRSLIEDGSDVNAMTRNAKRTPLMMAAVMGYVEILELLLNSGANIDQTDGSGNTALLHAATNQRLDMTELLVDRGANAFISGNSAGSPPEILLLVFSIDGKRYSLTRKLIDLGVDLNGRMKLESYMDWTPLIYATSVGDYEAAELLLKSGADYKLFDSYGRPALVIGIISDQKEIIKLLIEYGADPNESIPGYGSSIDIAKQLGKSEILLILENYKKT